MSEWCFDSFRADVLTRPPGATPPTPDPDPDLPAAGDYTLTIPMRLAPGALEGTVGNDIVIPLQITDDRLRTTGNGGSSLDNGQDIRLEIGYDGVAAPYIRDSYNATTGALVGLVRLPSGVGTAGLTMLLKVGDADGADQSADPALVFEDYLISLKSDGSDRVAGRDFTLGTGLDPDSERLDAFALPGDAQAVNNLPSWRTGSTICRMMLIKGVAGQLGTDYGWTDQGAVGSTSQRGAVARNRASGISPSSTVNSLFFGEQFSGGFCYVQGPGDNQIGTSWRHIIVNFSAGVVPSLYVDGRVVQNTAAVTPSGSLVVQPGPMQIGRGSVNIENAGWEGSIGGYAERSYVCGANEAALLCRMYNFDWNPIQLADSEGAFAALPTLPDLDGGGTTPDPDPGSDATPLPTPIRTVNVSNQSELDAAYADATAGDQIVLADGNYTIPNSNNWAKSGTVDDPIVLKAQNLLAADITANFTVNADNVILYGLDLPSRIISVGNSSQSDNVKFWRCRWRDLSAPSSSMGLRTYQTNDIDIAFCEWSNWGGRAISFGIAAGTRRPTVRRCYFGATPSASYTNAHEALQIGFGRDDRLIDAGALIELNLFEGWNSDDEAVSVKSSGNTLRQNRFLNTTGRLGNRMGKNNRYEANLVSGTGGAGIRIHDQNNVVLGNDTTGANNGIRVATGNVDATTTGWTTNLTPNAHTTYLGGNSGTLTIGHAFSGMTVDVVDTTVRQHSGAVSLVSGNHTGTDSQPGEPATGYSWASTVALTSTDVGPSAADGPVS